MFFQWFNSAPAVAFGKELAGFLLGQLQSSAGRRDSKFQARAEKVLLQADRRVRDFKGARSLNFWQRSKLSNSFLWTLKDGGCPDDYAAELTRWLTVRL